MISYLYQTPTPTDPKVGMEARLYGAMAGGLIFAIGSMIFAWAIKGHWVGKFQDERGRGVQIEHARMQANRSQRLAVPAL